MKVNATALAVTLTFVGIVGFFYGLAKFSQSTTLSGSEDQSFRTHLPTTLAVKKPKIEFSGPQPGIPFPRIDLDSKLGTKVLEDRLWNYVMDDKEFRKYFRVRSVRCSAPDCILSVYLEGSDWQDLQAYVKARPDFASVEIVIVDGKMGVQARTRKFQ